MADAVAPILAQDPVFGPLAQLTERMAGLDTTRLLVYLVDLVEADALPFLGEQFHVMGGEGWDVADDDAARRALIKSAIELHRYKGTPWAVKRVLGQLGIDVELLDQRAQRGVYAALNPTRLDGTWTLDGARKVVPLESLTGVPQIQHWAQFIVRLNLAEIARPALIERMRALVDEWKPARSWPIYTYWLRIRFDVALEVASHAVMQKRIAARYPWCGRVVSDRVDAAWRLGIDGQPATLPAPFGSFAVGRRYGESVDWRLSGCRTRSRAVLTSRSAVAMWPRETLPAERTLRTPDPVKLFRRVRRLDGAWRVGVPVKVGRFDLSGATRLARHPMLQTHRFGEFRLYEPARDIPDPRPARLSLSGRWRLGGPVNPGFRIQSTRISNRG